MEKKFDAYEMVTDRMIAILESGMIPWARPWGTVTACAWSRSTGKPYSFVNQMLLADPEKHYKTLDDLLSDVSGEWLTYNQAKELGGNVRKGEKGRKVIFFKPWERKTGKLNADGQEETETIPVIRSFTVFRVSQCDGITQKYHANEVANVIPEDLTAEAVAADYLQRSGVTYNQVRGNKAYYAPSLDLVVTPLREQFGSAEEYYSTLYHELTHSTGHKTRLNRLTEKAAFGDEVYSTEELVAEIGSASLMATLGIETDASLRNSAAYVQNWVKALKNDKKMIVAASSRAEKALRLILNIQE